MRLFAAFLLASVSLGALCRPAAADDPSSQIKVVGYSPTVRTEIIGIIGQPTTITFPKGESVYRVVQSGKPDKDGSLADAGWQGASPGDVKDTPLGNNLTLWPVAQGSSTMTVITMSADGDQKVYPFRLTALPNDATTLGVQGVVFNLIFKGTAAAPSTPQAVSPGLKVAGPSAPAAQAWKERQTSKQAQRADAEEHLRVDAFNGADGACHYHAHGKYQLLPGEAKRIGSPIEPRCPMDNGQWTLMRFPGLSKKPAVYIVTGEDDERLARQHASGDFVVVEEIAQHFRLRLGVDVLDILNDRYDPVGADPGTGTTAPTVTRDLIQAKQ